VTDESGHVVRIERTFPASAEDVFDAWTSPEVMRRWFHCGPDWDTPEAARTYFSLHQRVLKGKWKNMEVASQTDSEVRGMGDSGRFMLRISGASV